MFTKRSFVILALLAAASACGGGGSSATPPTGGGPANNQPTKASIRVTFPSAASKAGTRRPGFLTANTASFALVVYTVGGATPNPQPTPLTIALANTQYCTTSGSGTSCSVDFPVPIAAAVVIEIETFDANGNLIGGGFIGPIDTTQTTIPPQNITVGGVLATISLSTSALSAADDGTQHTLTFTVTGKDADGNTILPPGNYPSPISLAIAGDPNTALSLAPAAIASPGPNGATTVTLTYNSAKALTTAATISASASGATAAHLNFAPINFAPAALPNLIVGGSAATVTVSEPGYAQAFTPTGTSSVATVTCVPANCTPASAGGSVTINVAPGSTAGNQNVTVTDANNGFANVPITVTGSTGGGRLVGPPYPLYSYASSAGGTNYGITVGPDGQSLWFVDRASKTIGAVQNPAACNGTTCAISELTPNAFPSPAPAALQAITAAANGNLYIGDIGNTGLGDLGQVYVETCSATPSLTCANGSSLAPYGSLATPAPADIVAAPDGKLYISVAYSDAFTNGDFLSTPIVGCCSFSQFPAAPVTTSSLNMMAVGPNGVSMWFTDTGTGNVGFFSLPCNLCVVTEQPSGTMYGGGLRHRATAPPRRRNLGGGTPFTTPLNGIVTAPDGNIYIAEAGAHRIDQLNPTTWLSCSGVTCTYTPIPIPGNASAVPQNLTVGPDGNVWFTDSSGYVGFIALSTCSGGCKVYEYHVGGSPWGIVKGPDGNIWFTDSSTNKIGEVVLQ